MMRQHLKQMKNQKGMTLVEVLAVLVILALIAAIAIPMIGNMISDSQKKSELNDALNIIAAAKLADANGDAAGDDNSYTKTELVKGGYLDGSASTFTSVDKTNKQWVIKGYPFDKNTKLKNKDATESELKSALKNLK